MRSRQSCKPHAVRHDFRNTIGPRWPVSRRRGTFSAAGSGGGATGFDSTNTRKTRTKGKAKKSTDAQMIAPGIPVATAISPYDKSADVTGSVPAGTPGTPPVELGPIRTAPKKCKAHTEPEDPYAPLGIRAGAFDLFPAIEFIGGPSRGPNGKGAWLYTVAPELRAQSNWSRHELKADLRGVSNSRS